MVGAIAASRGAGSDQRPPRPAPEATSTRGQRPTTSGHQAACRQSHGEQAIVRRDPRRAEAPAVRDLRSHSGGSVLTWDEATYMPKGGTVARGRQSSLLRRLAHERFVDPALGRLIDRLEPGTDKLQTHGGFGFAEEYDVERKFRETRLYKVTPISTNLIVCFLAERALGLPKPYA